MDKQNKADEGHSVNEGIRLHVFLARHGVGSRRQSEEYIIEGLVRVNGSVITTLGTKVTPTDVIEYKGRKISWKEENKVYIALYKPEKYICSHVDAEDRPLAANLVQPFFTERLFYVGRLDYMTSGLLFLTNDGEFAKQLMHPSFEVEKEYEVRTSREIPEHLLERFQRGMWVNGERYQLKSYTTRGKREANLVLTEGKNQEIRQVFLSEHVTIKRIHRIRIGHVTLRGLGPGQFRKLTKQEVSRLLLGATPRKLRIYKESKQAPLMAQRTNHLSDKTDWVETAVHTDPALLRQKREKMEEEKRIKAAAQVARDAEWAAKQEKMTVEEPQEETVMTELVEGQNMGEAAEVREESVDTEPSYDNEFVEGSTGAEDSQLMFDFGDEFRAPEPQERDPRHDCRERGSYNDRPRREFNDRGREESRGGFAGDRPRRDFNDGPQRSFSDRGDRPQRGFSDRDRGGFAGDRPRRDFNERPQRSFGGNRGGFAGDRPRHDFNERPQRSFRGDRSEGDRPRPPFSGRDGGSRGGFAGDRPRRDFNDGPQRSFSDRGDRPQRGFSDRDRGGFAGDRPRHDFNERPQRSFRGDRSEGDRPRPPFSGRDGGSRGGFGGGRPGGRSGGFGSKGGFGGNRDRRPGGRG